MKIEEFFSSIMFRLKSKLSWYHVQVYIVRKNGKRESLTALKSMSSFKKTKRYVATNSATESQAN